MKEKEKDSESKKLNLFDLSGRIAIITGGAGLLGEMHAEIIAEAGGYPVLADINEKEAVRKAKMISEKYNIESLGIKTDITNKVEVCSLLDTVLKRFGRVDILINNAANDPKIKDLKIKDIKSNNIRNRFEHFSLEDWNNDISVGLTGAFICTQVIGTEMAKRKNGTILNISSDLGIIGPDQRIYIKEGLLEEEQFVKPVSYSVIKSAIIGLTRYSATYWADKNIRANAICPGGVQNNQSSEFLNKLIFRIPMNRMARKDEYKGAVLFLVSDASSYMTGSVLIVDGGRTCW